MAIPMCPKCNATSFKADNVQLSGMTTLLHFVYCSSCGAIVGVMDPSDVSVLLKNQNEAINQLRQAVAKVESNIQYIRTTLCS